MTEKTSGGGKMRFAEIMRLVWLNIMASKSKVFLTSLGIVVGAATIILVIAVGHGGEVQVQQEYKTLNAGSIDISVSTQAEMRDQILGGLMRNAQGGGTQFGNRSGSQRSFGSAGGATGGSAGGALTGGTGVGGSGAAGGASGFSSALRAQNVTLSSTDVNDISSEVNGLSDISLYNSGTASVNGGDLTADTSYTVVGADADYQNMCNLAMLQGDFITEDDSDSKNKVAVLGYTISEDIFGSAYSAVGENITIEGKPYTVVGVLDKMGSVDSGTSPDDSIFIPYSTGVKYVFGNSINPKIMAISSDVNDVTNKITEIKAVLTDDHPKATFTVADAGSTLASATSSAKTLSMLLLAVAVIVFVVGGIGIMNVMFVSVKERTQEIGILKALGTSKREILLQFLMEAMTISLMGGVVGVGAGFALVPLLRALGMAVEPLVVSGIYSMLFAMVTGTLFGLYPAWKASRLLPVEALSQE